MRASRISFKDQRSAPAGWGRRLMHALVLLIVVWLGGFLAFAAAIPPKVRDSEHPVDAIVVLTGGDVRLAEGFALLDRGLAKKMLISGVSNGVDLPALLQTLNGSPQPSQAVLDCCVTLGYDARSTEGNARESLRWLGENGFTSVRLVTANYHMNRSLLEFRRMMPGIQIIPNPVFPRQLQDPYWFARPNVIVLLFNEYHKYLVAAGRAKISDFGNTIANFSNRIAAMAGL
ncbi:MAG TPA: YdcF family protein [Dongiaceae bacterium]|nr:YdcF family protein [Dongiaceae bacterium]